MDVKTYGISLVTASIMLTVVLLISKNSSSYNVVKSVVGVAFLSFLLFPIISEFGAFSQDYEDYFKLEYQEINQDVKQLTEQNAINSAYNIVAQQLELNEIAYFEIKVEVYTNEQNLIELKDITVYIQNEAEILKAKSILDGIFLIETNIYFRNTMDN